MRAPLARALQQVPHLPAALALVWTAARRWTVIWAALLFVEGLLPVATVTLTRTLVNRFVAALGGARDWSAMEPLVWPLACLVAVILLWELVGVGVRWVRTIQAELIEDHITKLIHERSARVDLAFYESPEFYDRLYRARDDSGARSVAILEGLGSVVQSTITLIAMMVVLLPIGPELALALFLTSVPAVYVLFHHARLEHEWWREKTATIRRSWYYDWLLTTEVNAMEIRLFDLGEQFQDRYQELRAHLREARLELVRNRGIAEARASILAIVIGGAGGVSMLWRALQGALTMGDLALAYQAFQQGQSLARNLLGNLGQLYTNMLYLGSLFEFLGLQPIVADSVAPVAVHVPLREGIRFHGVAFHYPRSDRNVLTELDLFMPAGRITAIVGQNGSGKSTLIKLLCRFYDPSAGRITLDGVDLTSIRIDELRRVVTAVFQQPVRFSATVAENIAYGDLAAGEDDLRIRAAASAAGADVVVGRLPRRYETLLGNWFKGGNELSVGEWQRIALARALFRRAPILLLDEPTSAMDSWAEAEWLQRLESLVAGRTTLLVTHRFAAAMRADLIYVMAEGRVVEQGSHAELVALGGLYAQSWAAQATG